MLRASGLACTEKAGLVQSCCKEAVGFLVAEYTDKPAMGEVGLVSCKVEEIAFTAEAVRDGLRLDLDPRR